MKLTKPTTEERFWSKVDRSGGPDACWPWLAGRGKNGYGWFRSASGDQRGAHRSSWELSIGPIPPGLCVCHSCDNPPCVNPAHLWLGTHTDNNVDKMVKGRASKGESHSKCLHPARGERARSKLSSDAVLKIRELAGTISQSKIGVMFGISQAHVSEIVLRKVWTHI